MKQEKKIDELEKKIKEVQQESQEHLEGWKRAKADFINYKRRQEEISAEFRKFAREGIIEDFLPVLDNMELALEHVPEDQKDAEWIKGIAHIKRMLEDILKANGVEEIVVKEGDEFDPIIHEAVERKTHDMKHTTEKDVIKEVVRKGYRLNGKIIRVARIIM